MNLDIPEFTGKDVVFVGAGKGRSMAGLQEFLTQYGRIKSFIGVHSQNSPDRFGFLREYDPVATVFLKNEPVPDTEMPVPYVTPLQLFFRLAHANNLITVGITGTKGKSTTSALTAHMLQHSGKSVMLVGNGGVSALPTLAQATPNITFVLELSSYQLSDLHVSPHISACINLYNDHTDWHGSIENYWEAKHNIMRYAGPNDVFVYNPDFPPLREWARAGSCKSIAIDPTEQLDMNGAELFGKHNVLNALVAREIARQFGVDDAASLEAIRTFQPLQHRMQIVGTVRGRTYVDDAIGMTPESTMASLAAVTEKIGPVGCLLLGGQDRNYDYSILMPQIAKYGVPHLVLFPETEAKMKAAIPADYQPRLYETRSMTDAVHYANGHAPEGSVVLLSTAAPSYLLWRDFEDKGDQFQAAISAL